VKVDATRKRIALDFYLNRSRRGKQSLSLPGVLTNGLICCLLLISLPIQGQEQTPIRYRTEANFLAHFPSFVEWPSSAFPDSQAPMQLCLFGDADFGTSLVELTKDVKAQDRRIEVRSVKTTSQSRSCHILFIGREDAKRYGAILSPLQDMPVLTVGETTDFLEAGGIVNFVFGETLQIDINAEAADRAHLKIRSNLAALARRVIHRDKTKDP
jgi:YfiR/HmsC-like